MKGGLLEARGVDAAGHDSFVWEKPNIVLRHEEDEALVLLHGLGDSRGEGHRELGGDEASRGGVGVVDLGAGQGGGEA